MEIMKIFLGKVIRRSFVIIMIFAVCISAAACLKRPEESSEDAYAIHTSDLTVETTVDKMIHREEAPLLKESLEETSAAQSHALEALETDQRLAGKVVINGSGMMSLISERIAEQFRTTYPDMIIDIKTSTTEEGLKSLIEGKCDICNSSRAIKDSERQNAESALGKILEFKVAYDGIVLAVNKENSWVDTMTIEEIKKIWEPESQIFLWSDLNSLYPEEEIAPYGPSLSSGIMNFFCVNVIGRANAETSSYIEMDDYRKLVKCIAEDKFAIGIMSYSTYAANKEKLKALKIDAGKGPVMPSVETVKSGEYQALSSPMYLYASEASLQKPAIKAFIKYYLENASKLVMKSGYIPLPDSEYHEQAKTCQ